MTMRELARLANVSVSTVSKAFGDSEDVSTETKERIFAIAKGNGCFGKYHKEKYKKKIIAIICLELQSNYYSTFVEKLHHIIEEKDCIAVVSVSHFDKDKQAELIEYFASYMKVDGILVFGLHEKLKKGYDLPIVSIFSSLGGSVDEISIDFDGCIREAVNKLYRLGHRSIAYFSEKLTSRKALSFVRAAEEYKDMQSVILESNLRFEEAGEDCANRLILEHPESTAIICAYDNMAFGAMKALKKAGLQIPEDISVIGSDDLNVGKYMDLELSSMGCDPDEICHLAWNLLENKMKNKYYHSKQRILVHNKLLIRDTVAEAKKR